MYRASLLFAIVLLLLTSYVGSYLFLVMPAGTIAGYPEGPGPYYTEFDICFEHYRFESRRCSLLFWPLEYVDRKLRPAEWEKAAHFKLSREAEKRR